MGCHCFQRQREVRKEKGWGGEKVCEEEEIYRLERAEVVATGEVGAVRRRMPSVLREELKFHRILAVRIECMVL